MTPNRWMVNAHAALAAIAVAYYGATVTWGVVGLGEMMIDEGAFHHVSCSDCVCPSASPDPPDQSAPAAATYPDASSRRDPPRRAVLAALRFADRVPTPTASADDGVTVTPPSASRSDRRVMRAGPEARTRRRRRASNQSPPRDRSADRWVPARATARRSLRTGESSEALAKSDYFSAAGGLVFPL